MPDFYPRKGHLPPSQPASARKKNQKGRAQVIPSMSFLIGWRQFSIVCITAKSEMGTVPAVPAKTVLTFFQARTALVAAAAGTLRSAPGIGAPVIRSPPSFEGGTPGRRGRLIVRHLLCSAHQIQNAGQVLIQNIPFQTL